MTSDRYIKKSFESTIGIPQTTSISARPSTGFVVSRSQIEQKKKRIESSGGYAGKDAIYEIEDTDEFGDGLSAYGDIQVVLRPEVAQRTSYMRGDPISSGGRPVLMGSENREDILDALVNADGPKRKSHIADGIINLLNSRVKRENSEKSISISRSVANGSSETLKRNTTMHAEILGGYSLSDIEGIYYPFSKVEKYSINADLSDVTENLISLEEIVQQKIPQDDARELLSRINSGKVETPAIKSLRNYRTAMKIRKKYVDSGIGYVLFATKNGINIDNPRSYDPSARGNETVEDVLKRIIRSEIISGIKKLYSEMVKSRGKQ